MRGKDWILQAFHRRDKFCARFFIGRSGYGRVVKIEGVIFFKSLWQNAQHLNVVCHGFSAELILVLYVLKQA